MKGRRLITLLLVVAILLPFLANLVGWSLFLYVNLGEKDAILGASLGLLHAAIGETYTPSVGLGYGVEFLDDWTITLVEIGGLELFLEARGEPITPFVIRFFTPDPTSYYLGFDLPWLLLLVVPLGLWLVTRRREARGSGEG